LAAVLQHDLVLVLDESRGAVKARKFTRPNRTEPSPVFFAEILAAVVVGIVVGMWAEAQQSSRGAAR
jgi:hypothetical protein